MLRKIFAWLFIPSVVVAVMVTDCRVAMLNEQMKSVYQSLGNLHAEHRLHVVNPPRSTELAKGDR